MIIEKKKNKEAKDNKERKIQVEMDYIMDEKVIISMDVYQLTIAANLTKTCSPMALMFCLKQCFLCFIVQVLMALFFCYEVLDLTNF